MTPSVKCGGGCPRWRVTVRRTGDSTAYPVLRTTGAGAAYAQAGRLLALMAERRAEVWLFAELLSTEDVRRMAAVLPEGRFDHADMRTHPQGEELWFDLAVTTAPDGALEPHLPLDVMGHVPAGTAPAAHLGSEVLGEPQTGW